jgi:hypothetical protein
MLLNKGCMVKIGWGEVIMAYVKVLSKVHLKASSTNCMKLANWLALQKCGWTWDPLSIVQESQLTCTILTSYLYE